jgi:hypothetical protein
MIAHRQANDVTSNDNVIPAEEIFHVEPGSRRFIPNYGKLPDYMALLP